MDKTITHEEFEEAGGGEEGAFLWASEEGEVPEEVAEGGLEGEEPGCVCGCGCVGVGECLFFV